MRERKKRESEKKLFDPHMVVVETTIINILSLVRDLHMYIYIYEVLPRLISNGKDLQTNL